MSKVKIELNYAGVGALLKSEEVKTFIKDIADQRAAQLGEGYATDTHQAGTRVVASIYTETAEAAKDNLENNSLLRVVSG